MRLVADTNVVISGLIFGGKPDALLRQAAIGRLTLIYSPDLLNELTRILEERFLWSTVRVQRVTGHLMQAAEMVHPTERVRACVDPDDDRILEAAVEGRAEYIVSGDKHLLRMKQFSGIDIVSVHDFLLRIGL